MTRISSEEINLLIEKVRDFCEARDWDQFHNIKELAIGVSTESAELLELFRFRSIDECETLFSNPGSREKIEDELADVFFFLLRIAGRYDVDLREALSKKMQKNAEKYPVEKARGSNKKYDEF
jgi:NTP pyrophosphatase (non-canonical NTP hydrolase)